MRFWSSCWPSLWSSESLTGAVGSALPVAPMHAWRVSAGCWLEVSIPHLMDLSRGLELFSAASDPRESEVETASFLKSCSACFLIFYVLHRSVLFMVVGTSIGTWTQEAGMTGGHWKGWSLQSEPWPPMILTLTHAKYNHPLTRSSKVSSCFSLSSKSRASPAKSGAGADEALQEQFLQYIVPMKWSISYHTNKQGCHSHQGFQPSKCEFLSPGITIPALLQSQPLSTVSTGPR